MRAAIPPRSRADLAILAALIAIVIVVFGRAVTAGFVNWDDDRFLVKNPLFHAGGWSYVRAAWTELQFEAYQPLHLLAYLPDRALWPDDPAGFHALNLAIYAGDVALAYALVRGHAGRWPAALACLVIALHPLCAEPVAWITSRKDLVALAAFLGALLVEDRRPVAAARPHPLAIALALAALLAKSATVCLPLVMIAWLRWLRGATWRVALTRALPAAILERGDRDPGRDRVERARDDPVGPARRGAHRRRGDDRDLRRAHAGPDRPGADLPGGRAPRAGRGDHRRAGAGRRGRHMAALARAGALRARRLAGRAGAGRQPGAGLVPVRRSLRVPRAVHADRAARARVRRGRAPARAHARAARDWRARARARDRGRGDGGASRHLA